MDWSSLFATMYLLGAIFTAAITAAPIRRVMTEIDPFEDAEAVKDARRTTFFIVLGVAVIWPLSLLVYTLAHLIPASAEDTDDSSGVELVLAERYGRPE